MDDHVLPELQNGTQQDGTSRRHGGGWYRLGTLVPRAVSRLPKKRNGQARSFDAAQAHTDNATVDHTRSVVIHLLRVLLPFGPSILERNAVIKTIRDHRVSFHFNIGNVAEVLCSCATLACDPEPPRTEFTVDLATQSFAEVVTI